LDTGRLVSVIERLGPENVAANPGGSHQIFFCEKVPATLARASAFRRQTWPQSSII
jgi:hypothetical protein